MVKLLEPVDVVVKHAWLFGNRDDYHFADIFCKDPQADYEQFMQYLDEIRTSAIEEIYAISGTEALLRLAEMSCTAERIGALTSKHILSKAELQQFIIKTISSESDDIEKISKKRELIMGALRILPDNAESEDLIFTTVINCPNNHRIPLLTLAPYRRSTWNLARKLGTEVQGKYWKMVSRDMIFNCLPKDIEESAVNLFKAQRYDEALYSAQFYLEKVNPMILYEILLGIGGNSQNNQRSLVHENYVLSKAIRIIQDSIDLSIEQKALLEYNFLENLEKTGHYNLVYYVLENPDFWVNRIILAWKKEGKTENSLELGLPQKELKVEISRASHFLFNLNFFTKDINAEFITSKAIKHWITRVQNSSKLDTQLSIANNLIGRLLSKCPTGKDGIWPCELVRDVLEKITSEEMENSFFCCAMSSSGCVWRSSDCGGEQERELAKKYSLWSKELSFSHMKVSKILSKIATSYEAEGEFMDKEKRLRHRRP